MHARGPWARHCPLHTALVRRGKALARLVLVPADSYPTLHQAVMNEADAMNHHPDMEQTEEGAQITLWTHSEGGITAKDVTLAARIDQAISGAARDRAGGQAGRADP